MVVTRAQRRKTPNEIALTILLIAPDHCLTGDRHPVALCPGGNAVSVTVLVALSWCA